MKKRSPIHGLLLCMAIVQIAVTVAILAGVGIILAAKVQERATDQQVELSSRQCTLVQELAKSAILSVEAEIPDIAEHLHQPAFERQRALTELKNSFEEWVEGQRKLRAATPQISSGSQGSEMARSFGKAESSFSKIRAAVDKLLRDNGRISNHSQSDSLALILANEPAYRQSMSQYTALLSDSDSHGEGVQTWVLCVLLGFVLATLFGTMRLILRPTALRLASAYQDIAIKSEHLEDRNSEILAMQNEIEEQLCSLRESEARLQESSEKASANLKIAEFAARRFQEMFQGLPVACFTVDRDRTIQEWNKAAESLFELRGHEVFLRSIDEVLPSFSVLGDAQDPIAAALREQTVDGEELEHETALGATKWFMAGAFPLHSQHGGLSGVLCACVDITERKLFEGRLQKTEERIRGVVEAAGDAIITIDQAGLIRTFNPSAVSLFGYTQEEAVGQNVSMLMPEPHRNQHDGYVSRATDFSSKTKLIGTVRELQALRKDGTLVPIDLSLSRGVAGDEIFFTGIVRDISERKMLESEIERQMTLVHDMNAELELQKNELMLANQMLASLATKDGLTGLLNHRTFHELLEQMVQNAKPAENLSLLLIDIDLFKSFNDTYGHQAGDRVLRMVADTIAHVAEDAVACARYGGEELAVLHSDGMDAAYVLAERIRKAIENLSCEYRQVTVSIGVATQQSPYMDADSLIAEADQALYASKHSGRNRVTFAMTRVHEAA